MSKKRKKDGEGQASPPATPADQLLPGVDPGELAGKLIVIEGPDGSGRSTHIALLKEWLESAGYAVQTIGLRRSNLLARNIDDVLAKNVVGRLTLALLYATDFFDQLQNVMIPALRAGYVVLADRYIYTLIARAAVRGIDRDYLAGIYQAALTPDLIFWLRVRPEAAFDREFKKSNVISYWESGRDLNLSDDLFTSFVRYQTMLREEFTRMSATQRFIQVDTEAAIPDVNRELRAPIGKALGIRSIAYKPSRELMHLWR